MVTKKKNQSRSYLNHLVFYKCSSDMRDPEVNFSCFYYVSCFIVVCRLAPTLILISDFFEYVCPAGLFLLLLTVNLTMPTLFIS